jgi:plastocyanin
MTKSKTSMLWTSIASAILLTALLPSTIAANNNAFAFHTFGGTYVVNIIPGAAQQDSLYHFYPPTIAIPRHTEVAWFQGDPEQPHTVTSGSPGAADSGDLFNSGIMSYQYFFQYEFNVAGDYPYYCVIHPWRTANVHVGDSQTIGNNFEFSHGTDGIWSLSEFDRNLLKFEPTTVALEEDTPASYYFTMFNTGTGQTVYSGFFPSTNNFQIEMISSEYNQTTTYGPDRGATIRSSAGAFHVQGDFIEPGDYRISVAVTAVNGQPLTNISGDQFALEITE